MTFSRNINRRKATTYVVSHIDTQLLLVSLRTMTGHFTEVSESFECMPGHINSAETGGPAAQELGNARRGMP